MACSGSIALVTGGVSGIGLSCVEEILKNGAKGVAIADINSNLGEEVVKNLNGKFGDGKTIFIKTDISNKDSFRNAFQKTVEKYNNIDIIVNCAGIFDEFQWEKEVQINLVGTTYGCLLAIDEYFPKYKQGPKAYVINIASILGLEPFPAGPHYSSSKFGIIGLTRAFGANKCIDEKGIYVIAVCPGATETPMADASRKNVIYKEIMEEQFATVYNYFQPASVLGEAVIKALNEPVNGQVWLASDDKINRIKFPTLEEMIVP